MKRTAPTLTAAALAVLALAGCGAGAASPAASTEPTRTLAERALQSAADCGLTLSESTYDVGDSGRTFTFTTLEPGELHKEYGIPVSDVDCVLGNLGIPDRAMEHVSSTRALDGQQTDAWDDITARWTYHPDSGLNMTLSEG